MWGGDIGGIKKENKMGMQQQYDVVIVGSGLAGMTAALSLADSKKIALISKGQLLSGSSD